MSSNFNQETVTDIHHWTDTLFSFRTTRDPGFRFQSGQFIMMGLEVNGKPLTRASMRTGWNSSRSRCRTVR
jgi:ferredoxin--NADP+ reductase